MASLDAHDDFDNPGVTDDQIAEMMADPEYLEWVAESYAEAEAVADRELDNLLRIGHDYSHAEA